MAVGAMARPVHRRHRAGAQVQLPSLRLVIALVLVACLGYAYFALSNQVSAARDRVQRLESQLRAEQAQTDQLRMEIAELRSLDRVLPTAEKKLGMRAPTPGELTFVAVPSYVAAATNPDSSTGVAAASTVRAGRSAGGSAMSRARAEVTTKATGWWDRLVGLVSPGAAANEY